MALIARYVYNQEVTGTTNVTGWGNINGASHDLVVGSGFDSATQAVVDTGTGNKPLIQGKDTATGTKLETAADFGILTEGTIFIVGRQQSGTFQNDTNGYWLQGPEFFIQRGSGASVQAKFGVNTTTVINRTLTDGQVGIICFRFNSGSQKLQVNNGTAATSSDVDALGFNSKLELNYMGLKSYAEIRIYDSEMNDSEATAIYNELNTTYLSAPVDTTTVLNFPALPTKTVGDADFAPGATSNSPASITYSSSNTAVATIVSGLIHIVGPGTTTITAMQGAASGYTDPADETRTLTVNSNTPTMADVNKSIGGNVLAMAISTNLDTPAWKNVVCSTGRLGVDGTVEGGNTVSTRCGKATSAGTVGFTMPFSGLHNTAVSTSTEVSANEMAALFKNRTQFLVRIQDETTPANYFRYGTGRISDYADGGDVDGFVEFSGTITIDGDLELAP